MGVHEESSINRRIQSLKRDNQAVCVKVTVDEPNVKVTLATPACQRSGGGGRQPNAVESEIFDVWKKRHLDSTDFNGGEVVAFLNQLRNILR